MKHIKQLIIALLITTGGFSAAIAGGNSYGERVESQVALQERVQGLIHVPAQDGEAIQGTVELVFRIDELGRIEVLDIEGTHSYMTNQVENDVDNQRLNVSNDLTGKVFRMKLSYQS